jgi:glucose-6-phosphate isomerase
MIQLRNFTVPDATLKQRLDQAWSDVLKRSEVGFPRIPESGTEWDAIASRMQSARPAKRALILGIGGSSLGTQVLTRCFHERSETEIHYLESPDPYTSGILKELGAPEWKDKHVVIVSKSGNTLETLSWVEAIAARDPQWMRNSQVTVIASPGEGPLQKWAKREGVPCLWIPASVGGRFSVLSAVSMFPAALMGLELNGFRDGAAWALKNSALATNLSAQVVQGWARGEWITQMWTYSEGLRVFGEWWQQLWGESLAKKTKRDGGEAPRASTPMACSGPRDQHSLVQQLIEGAHDKQIFLTRVKSVESSSETFKPALFPEMPFHGREISLGRILGAEAQAFEASVKESGIHYSTIEVDKLDERTLGALFMLWQMVIAQLGEYMGIDTFNQPGVELGKKYAAKLLRE